MLNLKNWFYNNYENSTDFKLQYNKLLQSSYLTYKNLDDFRNPNYDITKFDIFKFITVLEYLFKINEKTLAYALNPYLINNYNDDSNESQFLVYNKTLEVNQYKNIIIDLYFLDIPKLAHYSVPLNILWRQVKDKTEITPYSQEIKELNEMGYGFEYFGNEATSKVFLFYLKAFYDNITLYDYIPTSDEEGIYQLSLADLVYEYSKNKSLEQSENIISSNLDKSEVALKDNPWVIKEWENLELETIKNTINNIKKDKTNVNTVHYKCEYIWTPSDLIEIYSDPESIEELKVNNVLGEYNFCYVEDTSFNNDLDRHKGLGVDPNIEGALGSILSSNINSKFVETLIK